MIEGHQDVHPIQQKRDVLDIPKSTYYDSHHNTISNRKRENNELIQRITAIHKESKERYGAAKIHHLLGEEGYKVSIKRVQSLMKAAGIRSITTQKIQIYS